MTSYSKLHRAVRAGELHEAHELFKDIMQQKIANRLAEEKKSLMEEPTKQPCPDCEDGDKNCKTCHGNGEIYETTK